jgi:phosphate transport system protein
MPSHLEKQINTLKHNALRLSTIVEDSVQKSLTAFEQRDAQLAERVIQGDRRIDAMEIDLEEECLKLLALYQPVALDLRSIISILKIDAELENIGDQAKDISRRVITLCGLPEHGLQFDFTSLITKVEWMLKNSLDALITLDAALARKVCVVDDEVDDLYDELIEQIHEAMAQHSQYVPALIEEQRICVYLEQIADYAKKIAEDVVYTTEAVVIRHQK